MVIFHCLWNDKLATMILILSVALLLAYMQWTHARVLRERLEIKRRAENGIMFSRRIQDELRIACERADAAVKQFEKVIAELAAPR